MASIIKANQLQDFGGNSIITSDGAGSVTVNAQGLQNTPAFHVTKLADQSSLSDNVFTTIAFDDVIIDTNNAYNTSTYRFTCPSGHSGTYFVGGMTLGIAGAVTQNSYSDIYIYKNDSIFYYQMSDMRNNHTYQIVNTFGIPIPLVAGDYVYLQVRFNVTTGTATLRANGHATQAIETNFYGYKLIGL